MTYAEQLKHPEWQKRRLHMLSAANWACSRCYGNEVTLHVHHKRYVKGRKAWEYEDFELEVLCEGCHADTHASKDLLAEVITRLPADFIPNVAAIIAGWCPGNYMEDILPEIYDVHSQEIGTIASYMNSMDMDQLAVVLKFVLRIRDEESQKNGANQNNQA